MMEDQQSVSSAPRVSRQARRARLYWDASYKHAVDDFDGGCGGTGSSSSHTEWIVSPTEVLRYLPTLHRHLRTRVLEIGCGDSLRCHVFLFTNFEVSHITNKWSAASSITLSCIKVRCGTFRYQHRFACRFHFLYRNIITV